MKAKVLLVEDHPDIANLVGINLRMLDYEVEAISDGNQALKHLHQDYQMAIFDIMLPGTDGLALCRRMRALNEQVPILMLTSKSSEQDVVIGLDAGADDYLCKPFGVLELQARVKALMRRNKGKQVEEALDALNFGRLSISPSEHKVTLDNKALTLTAKEFELCYFMARQPGRVFSRDQLMHEIWGVQHHGCAHTVNSTVNRLRAKLEPDASDPQWIQTVWGVGYKFAG